MARIELSGDPRIRCRIRLALGVLLVCLGSPYPTGAETVACLPGQKGCGEVPLEQKIQKSFDRATNVFVGRLQSIQDSTTGTKATRVVAFKIEKQFKGALAGDLARVSIDSYLTGGARTGAAPRVSLDEFERLEAEAESVDTEEAKTRYHGQVESLRREISKFGAAEKTPTHVVRLDLGSGDQFIRRTDIALRVGEKYAVFVFTPAAFAPDSKKSGGFITVVIEPVDLYSLNGERGNRALTALKQVSKRK
jgi:hypothetical protein